MIPEDWLDTLAMRFTRRDAGVAVTAALEGETASRFHGHVHQLGPPPTESTLFEIGDLTQIFTSILLALMVGRERLAYDQPVSSIVPELAGLPDWITPMGLATHTAGLPRVPAEIARRSALNMTNPYADFSVDDLLAWASRFRPKRPPAQGAFTYSIVGMGLLGFVLEEINRKRLDELFAEEIFKPLAFADTGYRLDDDGEARMATPHDGRGRTAELWTYGALAGAGGLISSPRDIVKLLSALISAGGRDDELAMAITETLQIRRQPQQAEGEGGGLGWSIVRAGNPPAFVFSHIGRTRGSQAFMLAAPQPKLAAAVLANAGPRARDTLSPPRKQMVRTFAMAWAEVPER